MASSSSTGAVTSRSDSYQKYIAHNNNIYDALIGLCAGRFGLLRIQRKQALKYFQSLPNLDESEETHGADNSDNVGIKVTNPSFLYPWKKPKPGITFRYRISFDNPPLAISSAASSDSVSPPKHFNGNATPSPNQAQSPAIETLKANASHSTSSIDTSYISSGMPQHCSDKKDILHLQNNVQFLITPDTTYDQSRRKFEDDTITHHERPSQFSTTPSMPRCNPCHLTRSNTSNQLDKILSISSQAFSAIDATQTTLSRSGYRLSSSSCRG